MHIRRQELRIAPATAPSIVEAMSQLCSVLAALVEQGQPKLVRSVINRGWPWTRLLLADDQLLLATQAGEAAELSESLGAWKPLADVLTEWRHTARAWAEGVTAAPIDEPLGTPVGRPA